MTRVKRGNVARKRRKEVLNLAEGFRGSSIKIISTYPAYASVKAELFARRPPAGTVVVVGALLDPRFLLEVEATAVLADSGQLPSTKE